MKFFPIQLYWYWLIIGSLRYYHVNMPIWYCNCTHKISYYLQDGQTALSIATERGHNEIVDLLKKAKVWDSYINYFSIVERAWASSTLLISHYFC